MEERFSFKNISVVSSKVISRATLHDIVINKLVVSHILQFIIHMYYQEHIKRRPEHVMGGLTKITISIMIIMR